MRNAPLSFTARVRRSLLPVLGFTTALISGALAQNAPPGARLAAVVVRSEGDTLDLTDNSGHPLTIRLADDARISGIATAKPEDIQPGSYVGSAALTQPDGTLQALEVHVFPPSMRGAGEGHRPWGQDANASMTNGTVGDLVITNGRTMTVKYGDGGVQKIVVPPDVPIVSIEPGDRSLLVPGAHVVAFYAKAADGTLTASRLAVGKNGTIPPM